MEEQLTLALYPNTKGFGFACLEMPQNLLDSGVFNVRPLNNDRMMKQIKLFTEFHKPIIVLLRDPENATNSNERLRKFTEEIVEHARTINTPVYLYSKEQIRQVFEVFGATTKMEIAHKICSWFSELKPRMPKERKPWMEEDYNLGIFNAVSLAITHLYLEK